MSLNKKRKEVHRSERSYLRVSTQSVDSHLTYSSLGWPHAAKSKEETVWASIERLKVWPGWYMSMFCWLQTKPQKEGGSATSSYKTSVKTDVLTLVSTGNATHLHHKHVIPKSKQVLFVSKVQPAGLYRYQLVIWCFHPLNTKEMWAWVLTVAHSLNKVFEGLSKFARL